MTDSSLTDILLWAVLPYVMVGIFVTGVAWRYRYDQFGWTTRSSELYESRLLRIGSPLFHFGLVFVVAGHVLGLIIPDEWTTALGVTETRYHYVAYVLGGLAGFCTLVGIAILLYRRRTKGPVFMATTRNDKMMYLVLVATICAGLWTTVAANSLHQGYNYRETIGPWFRGLFILQPEIHLIASAPLTYQVHALIGIVLFILWPFTRLVHAFSAPVKYLFRPYIVYRSRDVGGAPRTETPGRGWDVGATRPPRTSP